MEKRCFVFVIGLFLVSFSSAGIFGGITGNVLSQDIQEEQCETHIVRVSNMIDDTDYILGNEYCSLKEGICTGVFRLNEDELLVGVKSSDPKSCEVRERPNPKQLLQVICCNVGACIETDNGDNLNLKGTVHTKWVSKTDECIYVNHLADDYPDLVDNKGNIPGVREYSCDSPGGSNINTRQYICPNGCKDGACLNSDWGATCSDNDDGKDIYNKGTVIGERIKKSEEILTKTDACTVNLGYDRQEVESCSEFEDCFIREYSCTTRNNPPFYNYSSLIEEDIPCPNGCKDGACLPQEDLNGKDYRCFDSDNGKDFSVSGDSKGYNSDVNQIITNRGDSCLRDGKNNADLQESYCENNELKFERYNCPYGCMNGVCIEEDVQVIMPEENKPVDLANINSGKFESEKVVCFGCILDNKCYPIGYRKSGEYCSDSQKFVSQVESGLVCENNFECGSNVCVSGQCVSEGLLDKILNWFKKLFG